MPGAQDNVGAPHIAHFAMCGLSSQSNSVGITVLLLPLGAMEVEQFPGLIFVERLDR